MRYDYEESDRIHTTYQTFLASGLKCDTTSNWRLVLPIRLQRDLQTVSPDRNKSFRSIANPKSPRLRRLIEFNEIGISVMAVGF